MDLYLVSQQLKVNKTVPYSNQVLHLAMILSSFEHFEHLLQLYGTHINDQDSNGNTLLHIAVINKKIAYIPSLYHYDIDDTILNNQHKSASDLCDDSVFGINMKQTIINFHNTYQLHCIQQLNQCISDGQSNGVKTLLTNKCIHSVDFNQLYKGNTLLHQCVLLKRTSILQLILQYCDPLVRNDEGLLPIDYCHSSTEDKEIAALLKQQMTITPKLSNKNEMSGILLKYTNIANGYKQRWFILNNYYLYYKKYKQQHHYRGKLHVSQLKLIPDTNDVKKFLIQHNHTKWHLKAEHGSEGQKWVLHILQAQKSYKDISSPLPPPTAIPTSTLDQCMIEIATIKAQCDNDLNLIKELALQYHTSHESACFDALCTTLQHYTDAFTKYQDALANKDICYDIMLQQERQEHCWVQQPPMQSPEQQTISSEVLHSNDRLQSLDPTAVNVTRSNSQMQSSPSKQSISDQSSGDEFFDASSSLGATLLMGMGYPKQFRQHLPVDHLLLQNEVSIISILKDAIGKDLTRITLPVYFNEPISMLQRLCEEIEYSHLLDMAANSSDPLERLAYVSAYAMSGYASTADRLGKPFNPLLGETFEFVHEQKHIKYISEQVSHHPPISACHCEGNNWIFYSEADVFINLFRLKVNLEVPA